MANKRNQAVEMRIVAEWLAINHAGDYYQTHVRLGSLPAALNTDSLDEGATKYVYSAFARWADAVVILPDRTRLIEAKIIAHPNAIGQLMLYKRLIPSSPYLNLRADKPVEPVLLFAKADPVVTQLAIEQGITVIQYDPPWVDGYLETRFHRMRSAPMAQELTPAPE